jgi:hypothetical protein
MAADPFGGHLADSQAEFAVISDMLARRMKAIAAATTATPTSWRPKAWRITAAPTGAK